VDNKPSINLTVKKSKLKITTTGGDASKKSLLIKPGEQVVNKPIDPLQLQSILRGLNKPEENS